MSAILTAFVLALAAVQATVIIGVVILFAVFGVGVCHIIGRLTFTRQLFGEWRGE